MKTRLSRRQVLQLRGLHCVARALLLTSRPLRAKAMVDRIARYLEPLVGADEALAAVEALLPSGSCLSRAMTVAAAMPGAQIVVGVDRWTGVEAFAHAWLEIEALRVDASPGRPPVPELARFPPTPPHQTSC
jgi:hypothetical protein